MPATPRQYMTPMLQYGPVNPGPVLDPAASVRNPIRAALTLVCALQCAGALAAVDAAAPATVESPAPAAAAASNDDLVTLATRRHAAQQTFLRLSDEKRMAEARDIAEQIVDLTVRLYGATSIEMAAPRTNLATTQLALGDLAGAAQNYRAAIDLIERGEGPASPRLVNPLLGLGETCIRNGLYDQARDAYQRALRINHIDAGFYNAGQFPIMDGLTEAWLGLNQLEQANAQQTTQVAIQRHRSGPASEELVPVLYKLGRWYNRTGQYVESRNAFQTARRIIREQHGDTDPTSVDALLGEALSYTNEGAMPASASTLKRALEVLDGQPERDHRKRAEVLVALGDLYTLNRQPRAAGQRYAQAWQELSGDVALAADRDGYFGQVSRISGPRLPEAVDADGRARSEAPGLRSTWPRGAVLAEFTVDADGDARDIRIVESDPPGLLDQQVLRVLAATAFRPRLADGVPTGTTGVTFRHEFRHEPPAAAPPAKRNPQDDTDQDGGRLEFPDTADPHAGADGR